MKKKEKRKLKKVYKIFLSILIIASTLVIYSHFIGTKGLLIREYAVINEQLPESFNGFKIVHFSDLHYGTTVKTKEVINLVKQINELKPDLVVFTGDMVDINYNITEKEISTLSTELNKIEANIGKYIVRGNHDTHSSYDSILTLLDFTDLNNLNKAIFYESNTPIYLVGLDDYLHYTQKSDIAFNYYTEDTSYYTIVLAHEPDTYDKIKDYKFNLLLSGHSHNGQVRLPFIGAIYTPIGSKKYYDEKYEINDTSIYISGGIGTSSAPFRFLTKPSFNFYRLYNQ